MNNKSKNILSEKFKEESDPIKDLGIGLMHEIKDFCQSKYSSDDSKEDFLETCVEYGKLEYVKYLLDIGADVYVNDALRWAAHNGHIEIVKILLDAGADASVDYYSALRWAARGNHRDVVKLLKDHIAKEKKKVRESINISEKFKEDSDPIKDMGIGIEEQIKRAFKRKIPNADYSRSTALMVFAGEKDPEITGYIKTLIDLGVNVHVKANHPLRVAAVYGNTEVLKLLIDAGANVHARNDEALYWAIIYGSPDAVKVLLEAGATVNDQAYQAAMINKNEKILKLLKDYDKNKKKVKESINISEKFKEDSDPIKDMDIGLMHEIRKFCQDKYPDDNSKEDFLVTCAEREKLDYVKYLLNTGADVHADNDYALRWAAANGHAAVVKILLDAGADVSAQNDEALVWAAVSGYKDVVKLLLDAGADVHAENDHALQLAAENGHAAVVKILLDAGAYVSVGDDYALQLAAENGHAAVVKILKDHIAKEKKKVKESINISEKFKEESDPIKDMGIGLEEYLKREIKKLKDYSSDSIRIYNKFYKDKYGEEYIDNNSHESRYIKVEIVRMIYHTLVRKSSYQSNKSIDDVYSELFFEEVIEDRSIDREKAEIINDKSVEILNNEYGLNIIKGKNRANAYIEENFLKKNTLDEKFSEESDPITDMSIGMEGQIKKWFKKEFPNMTYGISTALYKAAEYNKYDFVKYILEKMSDVIHDFFKTQALLYAIKYNNKEIVKLLIDYGVSLSNRKNTPINRAVEYGHTDIVKMLLDAGVDVNTVDKYAINSALYKKKFDVIELLYKSGISRNKIAPWLKFKEMQKKVKESINISEKFKEDSDPIKDMDIGLMHEIRKFCQDKYPDDNSKEDFLVTCAEREKLDYVKYLLDAGVNVHTQNDYALRWAAANGHTDIVKVLLDADANVHARDDEAFKLATKNRHKDVIKLLKDHITKEKKKVKESINISEKFKEDSDPIHDMGIGKYKVTPSKYANPLIMDYFNDETPKTGAKTKKYFNKFKEEFEPLIKDMYVKGDFWRVGKGWAYDRIIKIEKIVGASGVDFFNKDNTIWNFFRVKADDGERYEMFCEKIYTVSGSPETLKNTRNDEN